MLTLYKGMPDIVVLPTSTFEVQAVVRICREARVPVVPRGSGTGLIGGATAPLGVVMVSLTRMRQILELDLVDPGAAAQPRLINISLTNAVRHRRCFFALDPPSH